MVVVAGLLFTVPYYALAPGSARDVPPLMSVDAVEAHETGEILYLTIQLEHVSLFGALRGWLDADIQVVPEEAILGDGTEEENTEVNRNEMAGSKDIAQLVAFTRLGYDVETTATGAHITSVTEGTPADGVLDVGDTIVAVDGQPVSFPTDLQRLVTDRTPGTTIALTIDGIGADGAVVPREAEVDLARCGDVPTCAQGRPDQPDSAFLGVASEPRDFDARLPFEVAIDTRGVGGPSAGLAFTLSILDLLTDGDLTGGRRIAVTGTIEPDGSVGNVGGVVQKAAAAAAAGAEVLLVPRDEFDLAADNAHGLSVIPVSNLDEALAALLELGGDPLPDAPPLG